MIYLKNMKIIFQEESMQFSEATKINDFKASKGWLGKVLKQYGWNYLNLHWEADEMSYKEFNKFFQQWTEKTLEKNIN